MKLWLIGLGLALLCTVNAESECSIDHSQMHGKWYVNGMATDCKHLLDKKDMLKILVAHVSLTDDNNLKVTTAFPNPTGGCKKVEMKFEKLMDGTYHHSSERGSTKKMEVVATDCETYAMVFATMQHREKTSNHLCIYTRKPELTPELMQKFLESCASSNFTNNQIFFPKEVACESEA